MTTPRALVALSTAPTEKLAASIARTLVEEKIVTCVNLVPGVRSIYRWRGEVSDEREVLLVMKAARAKLAKLKRRLPQLHPYEVPELVVLEVRDGLPGYLAWLTGP